MRRIWFIRHGKTEANAKFLYYGATDLPLSEEGREELLSLRQKGGYPDISEAAVYTSGYKRTDETLDILYPGVKAVKEPGLAEMNFGVFEMRSHTEMEKDAEYIAWKTGDNMANVCPGGESGNMQKERVLKAFGKILGENSGDIMIVCHSGTIANIMYDLFPRGVSHMWEYKCENGCGYELVYDGDKRIGFEKIPR